MIWVVFQRLDMISDFQGMLFSRLCDQDPGDSRAVQRYS